MKYYWFNKKCCVPECNNSSTEGEGCYKEFFNLPAEPTARARWLKAVLSEDGENLKICEDHFKEEDIFRDKKHRKKLRLNSVPSVKLPQNICSNCLGSTSTLPNSKDIGFKRCQCLTATMDTTLPSQTPLSEKKSRISWTSEERRILFKAIRKHGNVKMVNNSFRINWECVLNSCRDSGCFGNEKELKNAWQYLRTRAMKVYKNEVYGTKLDRKISRFLYGKSPKINRIRSTTSNSVANGSIRQSTSTVDSLTSDDAFEEISETNFKEKVLMKNDSNITKSFSNDNSNNNDNAYPCEMQCDTENKIGIAKNESADTGNETFDESDEEYYSIEDIKNKLGIDIDPKIPNVISLISSDDSDPE